VAGQIVRVEGEIKDIREQSQSDALWRGKEMIDVDSESLRLKQAQVALERDLLPLRQDLARATRDVSDLERGSLPDRTALIEMDGKRKELRLQEIELEKSLIGLGRDDTRRKAIQDQIDRLHDQDRLLSLEADRITTTNSLAATAARVRREGLDDQVRGQQTVIDRIKEQIDTLGAERDVFNANESVIKNATDNEVAYRQRLIDVFRNEGQPLRDRIAAGLALIDQLQKEGAISNELADRLRDEAKEAGAGATATQSLGAAAATATPQMDAASRKAAEMAEAARKIADQSNAASGKVDALSRSLGSLPSWFTPKGSGSGAGSSGLFNFGGGRASGGPVTGGIPYVIGERGPELFVPDRSGTILPAEMAQAWRGGSRSGGSVETHRFQITGPDGRTLAEWYVRGRDMAVDTGLVMRGSS
jgi:hypothetical protein